MKKRYIPTTVVLSIMAIIIAIFSYYTVWLGDDINYAYDFRPNHRNEIVSSFGQIIKSLNVHYMTVNGRHLPHIFVQFFCGIWGHAAFAVANAIFYVIFMLALFRLCHVKLDNSRGILSAMLFALIVFQTKMVPSCQIGYIWTFALSMIFLIYYFTQKIYNKWWQITLLGILSLCAGNGNEALSLGVSGALVIYWVRNMRQMSIMQYAMMICYGLGTFAICLSPAAHSRAVDTTQGLFSITGLYLTLYYFIRSAIAIFVLIAVLLWQKYKYKENIKRVYLENSFFFNVLLIMLIFNALIGFASNRQIFGAELMAIIITMRLLKKHYFNYFWISVSTIILTLLYLAQAQMIYNIRNQYYNIEQQYSESSDGKVFVDINNTNCVPFSMEFSERMPFNGINPFQSYSHLNLSKWLKTLHPGHGELVILPASLQNYTPIHSEIISLPQEGMYFLIKFKDDNKKVYIERNINKIFTKHDIPPQEAPMNEGIIFNDSTILGQYVDINEYTILGLSHQSISLR